MQTQANLFTRHDTMLGICEGAGRDLGIHPNLLRLAFAFALFFNPVASVSAYAFLGLIVLASRFAFPTRAAKTDTPAETAVDPVQGDNDQAEPFKLAA